MILTQKHQYLRVAETGQEMVNLNIKGIDNFLLFGHASYHKPLKDKRMPSVSLLITATTTFL